MFPSLSPSLPLSLKISKHVLQGGLKISSNVNNGLWVIMMCQHRCIDCKKCTPVVPDVISGGGHVPMETGGVWGISVLPLNLVVNVNVLRKKV